MLAESASPYNFLSWLTTRTKETAQEHYDHGYPVFEQSMCYLFRWRVVDYYMTRVNGNMRILEQLDMVGKTSELSRLFGIQFLEVLTRGSQFRVESIMLRLVRGKNFVPVSPSIKVRSVSDKLAFLSPCQCSSRIFSYLVIICIPRKKSLHLMFCSNVPK